MPVQTSLRIDGPAEVFPGFVLAPTGGLVLYVHASGAAALNGLPAGMGGSSDGFFTSLNAAMNVCRANRGDCIICLPGHTESVATATALSNIKAGVTVYGVGSGDERPTFNWTAAASTWAISAANVVFKNCRLNFAATAATTVTQAMAVTAARLGLVGCEITLAAAGGAQLAAIGVNFGAGSDRSYVEGCEIVGAPDGGFTDGFLVSSAINRFRFRGNFGSAGPAGANGILRFSAAATNINVADNDLENTLAGANSTAVFVGFAGLTGIFPRNALSVQNNGTASAQGIITAGNTRAIQTFTSDEAAKSGLLSPGAAT